MSTISRNILYLVQVLTYNSLIMLLIQSDMFKALWFMLYPIVVFVNGPVKDTSAFCQVNGFMISLGIEASGRHNLSCGIASTNASRFLRAHDRGPQRLVYIQATVLRWRGWLVSTSENCVYTLGRISSPDGLSGLYKRSACICFRRDLLLSSGPTFLVSISVRLDTSIYHFYFHSRHICVDILLCTI